MAEKTVQIPLSLFLATIDLLERIDTHMAQPSLFASQQYILSAFMQKKRRLELRKYYSDIIFAQNDDDRWEARMDYLQKKRDISQYR
jgi:hypothetical protein